MKWLIFILILFVIPFAYADASVLEYSINNSVYDQYTNYSFFSTCAHNNLDSCWFEFGSDGVFYNTSVISISGGSDYCENISKLNFPVGSEVTVRAWVYENPPPFETLNYSEINITIERQEEALSIRECSTETGDVILLSILFMFAMFLMIIALAFRLIYLGVISSLLIIVMSWYIAPCVLMYSIILVFLGIMMFLKSINIKER